MSGGTMRFAANMGLAHMWCHHCKEERLHHKMRCVSCKTPYGSGRVYTPLNWNSYQGNLGRLNTVQRAQVLKERAEAGF
jgi:hypothetical protein